MTKIQSNRRTFIRNTAVAAAGLTILPREVLGGQGYVAPSDKVQLGFIGTGKLTQNLSIRFAELPEVQITAGCDVDSKKLERFRNSINAFYAEKAGKERYDKTRTYEKYEDLIADRHVDAVVVVTPDHWHAIPSIAAMEAGKDVYCEKPLAHTVEEGRAMVEAARKYERIVQTGSMQRSWPDFRKAVELVRNGYVGEIRKVVVNVGDPAVDCLLPAEDTPEYLNWDRWVGPAQYRPYNQILSPPIEQNHWPRWRDYREYGGGGVSDWGAHMFDIAQWALDMDRSGPVKYISPELPEATRGLIMQYANGVIMTHEDFGRGWAVRFHGTQGILDVSREFLDSKPEWIALSQIEAGDGRVYHSENHYQNWIDCIKNRTLPVADVETGHRTATVCNIANLAYRLRRPLEWDPEKEEFIKDEEANGFRGKKYREPYSL